MSALDIQSLKTIRELMRGDSADPAVIEGHLMALVYVRELRFIGATCSGCDCADAPRHKDAVWVDPLTDKWRSTHALRFLREFEEAVALATRLLPDWQINVRRCGHPDGNMWWESAVHLVNRATTYRSGEDEAAAAVIDAMLVGLIGDYV